MNQIKKFEILHIHTQKIKNEYNNFLKDLNLFQYKNLFIFLKKSSENIFHLYIKQIEENFIIIILFLQIHITY